MKIIDQDIEGLRKLTDKFIFIEYYPHTNCDMYKILNEYTKYAEDKIVLCSLEEGFERALFLAKKYISEAKLKFDSE